MIPGVGDLILGTGIDIVKISRIRRAWERTGEHFLERIFSVDELEYCRQFPDPWPHLGSRFAAKESVIKALGFAVDPLEIEIRRAGDGQPVVVLSDRARSRADDSGVGQVIVSMSHTGNLAIAQAIALKVEAGL
jgi:holo-[acyl-carrier protein] synthase